MNNIIFGIANVLILLAASGCSKYILAADIYNYRNGAVIQLEDKTLKVTELNLTRVYKNNGEFEKNIMWLIRPKNKNGERYLSKIYYGEIPSGYKEIVKSQKLVPGYYYVDIIWSPTPKSASLKFLITSDLSILKVNIKKDFNEFYSCLKNNSFEKGMLLKNCKNKDWIINKE